MKLPGAYVIMLAIGVLLSIYFPLLFLRKLENNTGNPPRMVHKFGAILLGVIIMSAVLRLQHWSIVRFENDEIIKLFTFSPYIYVGAYCAVSFIFIPWLLLDQYKHNKQAIIKNGIGGLGLAIVLIGLIGYDYHDFYWGHLLIIGNTLLVLIYLPLQIFASKDDHDNIFQILIIGYILMLLMYGIFWNIPATYQDFILKNN